MARTYKRDSRGRFASTGGSSGSGGRPKARMQQRGTNRLTRDNAGRIQGIGGSGATARGGRLRTASGKQRGAVLMKAQGQGGVIAKDRSRRMGTRSESGRLKVAAMRARKKGQRDFNAGGDVIADKMLAKAARLDKIAAADRARAAAAKADQKKRAKVSPAQGSKRDSNRLRTLNNRLRYYKKEGLTSDELSVAATRSARNALAKSMAQIGGQRINIRTRGEAIKSQRARTRNLIEAGNARARLHQRDGGVNIRMEGAYGVRKRKPTYDATLMRYSTSQPGRGVRVPVTPGGGRRLKAKTIGTQGDLFGEGRALKVFRPTQGRPTRRR